VTTASPVIHVVDDDTSMRTSLARLLSGAGYAVALYATAEEFLQAAGPALTGCILLDLRLPGASGLDVQRRLAERGCPTPIVFLTAHGDLTTGIRAMKGGAADFLEKPAVADELFAAIATAVAREADTRRQREELAQLRARVESLSDREREVWLHVARGQLNKQIAYDLGIVERTVKLHRARAMEKLGAQSTADLVRIAERLGLPGGPD